MKSVAYECAFHYILIVLGSSLSFKDSTSLSQITIMYHLSHLKCLLGVAFL